VQQELIGGARLASQEEATLLSDEQVVDLLSRKSAAWAARFWLLSFS